MLLLIFLSLVLAPAQAPGSYKIDFENDWLSVTRVTYPAKTTLPLHSHPDGASAFVYLTDSPGVIFRHHNKSFTDITRQPVKIGAVRLGVATFEEHEVINETDATSVFLRIAFKTEGASDRTLRGRFPPVPATAGNMQTVTFENAQLRMSRIALTPGQTLDLTVADKFPSLVVAIPSGKTTWLAAGDTHKLSNTDASVSEWLRFELKTAPVK